MDRRGASCEAIVDCMACLVAMTHGRILMTHPGTHVDKDGVVHAANAHPSYWGWQAVVCSADGRGGLTLVMR